MGGKPGVRVRRVYDEPEPDDGTRVLVDRIWPRGLTKGNAALGEWRKEIAPSTRCANGTTTTQRGSRSSVDATGPSSRSPSGLRRCSIYERWPRSDRLRCSPRPSTPTSARPWCSPTCSGPDPRSRQVDAELLEAAYQVFVGKHDDVDAALARRVGIAVDWLAKAWRNTRSVRVEDRIVLLNTGFEALIGTSTTHRSARRLQLSSSNSRLCPP